MSALHISHFTFHGVDERSSAHYNWAPFVIVFVIEFANVFVFRCVFVFVFRCAFHMVDERSSAHYNWAPPYLDAGERYHGCHTHNVAQLDKNCQQKFNQMSLLQIPFLLQ